MELVFACEQRFLKDNSGNYYTDNPSSGNVLWERYLKKFEHIIIFSRVKHVDTELDNDGYFLIKNSNISFIDVPYYVGPKEYLLKKSAIKEIARQTAVRGKTYICRAPGKIGELLSAELRRKNIPYAVEVVGDPWDVFAPGIIKHPLSPLFRILEYWILKKMVQNASAALYVTKNKLQKRYPVKQSIFNVGVSDVVLPSTRMICPEKQIISGPVNLLAVGSLAQMYKSPDVAVKTIALLVSEGVDCRLLWLGDGKFREPMISLATELGVQDNIDFRGNVSATVVCEELAKAHIFLHISRTEGLPRAVIEAMSAGLPCIGSRVGGIPELLEDVALVGKIAPKAVAAKIREFIQSPDLMSSQAKRNFEESQCYQEPVLAKKRNKFYETIIGLSY